MYGIPGTSEPGVPGTPAQAVRQAGRPANAGHGVGILAGGATPRVRTTARSYEPTHSGIRAASPGRDARKDAEHQEVRLVGGEERLDACLPVSCGKERIQQSLAAQRELLQPCEKLPHGTSVGERLHDVARRPPLLGNITCRVHVERLRESTGVGDDMDELRQYLRGDSDDVARREHLRQRNARASVLGVLSYLRGHKEPGVEAMDHGRPSSISPSKSSSEVSGQSTEPRSTVAMSRTLCDRDPSIRGAGDTVPCASTVTSCPSGKHTPLSSTTTPFCTRPWATMRNLVQSRVTDADSSDFITRGIREKSVLRSRWAVSSPPAEPGCGKSASGWAGTTWRTWA